MTFIKNLFVVFLVGALIFMGGYWISNDYFNEYGITNEDDSLNSIYGNLSGTINSTKDNSLSWQRNLSQSTTESGFTIIESMFKIATSTLKNMLSYLGAVTNIIPMVAEAIGIPSWVVGIFTTLIVLVFLIAIILIILRSGLI